MDVLRRASASGLSAEWDRLAGSYFQKRKFLLYSETYNPCLQRYYELWNAAGLAAGACVYTLRLDLLTFARIKSPVRFAIVGLPASISSAGLIGADDAIAELLQSILASEKGLVLLLNLPPGLSTAPAIKMRMMPTVMLRHDFGSWDEYRHALRSSYRRRLMLNEKAFEGVRREEGPCSRFSAEMYALYLQVMARTTTKLEELSFDYFHNLPEEFTLTTYSLGGRVIAWHINLREDRRLTFFFGGTDEAFVEDRRAYQNNLMGILKEAFGLGCREIDLGQTAEIAKTRLGGALVEKNMAVYSRNPVIRRLLWLGRWILQYHRHIPEPHVFVRTKDRPA